MTGLLVAIPAARRFSAPVPVWSTVPVWEPVRPALAAAAVGPHAHGPRTARADRDDLYLEDAARKSSYRDVGDAATVHLLDAATIDVHGHAHDPRAARLGQAEGELAQVLAASPRRRRGGGPAARLRVPAAVDRARGRILLGRRKGEVGR